MPWCPKCKSEYREGFTVCADCGSELVDEETFEQSEQEELAAAQAQAQAQALAHAAKLAGVKLQEDPEAGPELPEAEDPTEPGESPEAGPETEEASGRKAGYDSAMYQDSTERASENRSSAWILLIMGGAGLAVIALGIMGALPLRFDNPYLSYGVMAAVFLLFLVAGVVSMKNARIFEKKAESENSLRDTMLDWCRENLHPEKLDAEIGAEDGETKEALYFKRSACIRAKLNYQFVNLDQAFLENFIDDSVYDMVYGKSEESV